MGSDLKELSSVLSIIKNVDSKRPIDALALAKDQLLPRLLKDENLNSIPVAELIETAAEISSKLVASKLPTDKRQLDIRHDPYVLEVLYDHQSEHYQDDKQEAFLVCVALACYFQKDIQQSQEPKRQLELKLHLICPLFRSISATYENCQYETCKALADKCLKLISLIDCKKWQQQLPELNAFLETVRFHTTATKVKSMRELKEYDSAALLLNTIIVHQCISGSLDLHHEMQILFASILIYVERIDEAQKILHELRGSDELSETNRKDLESNLAIIRFYNEGDYRAGYAGILSGLSDEEKSEFYNILDAEYSGIPNEQQIQRKEHLFALAFSEERLTRVLSDTGDKHLVHELHQYKKQYVAPRIGSTSEVSITQLFVEHDQAISQQDLKKASRTLMLIGKSIESSQKSPGDFHDSEMKRYLEATIASNDLDLYLTQSEFFAPVLTNAKAKCLKKVLGTIEQFFMQLTRLARDSSLNVTPQRQRTELAMRRMVINNLLSLLAELTLKFPKQTKRWLSYIADLKQCWDFSGLRVQLQQQLFDYKKLNNTNDIGRIEALSEAIAVIPRSQTQRQQQLDSLSELNQKLLPMRTAATRQIIPSTEVFSDELVFLDFNANTDSPANIMVTGIIKNDDIWKRRYKSTVINCKDIQELVNMLRPEVPASETSDKEHAQKIQKRGKNLTKQLLPERLFTSPPKCIGVRSTGTLQDLPLEALAFKSMFGWYWFGSLTTTVTLTDTIRSPLFVKNRLKTRNITIFANPNFAPPLPPLEGTSIEANTIEKIAKNGNVEVSNKQGNKANREVFLSLSGNTAPQILHIATHGIVNKEFNELSLLALSCKNESKEYITPNIGFHDICLMDMRLTELVVLSACSTHEGKPIMGESANSLAWGFKAAGVKAVIGARWQVNDEAAILFWDKFYTFLINKGSIVEALTNARKSLIRSKKWRHPKYWAAYQLIV